MILIASPIPPRKLSNATANGNAALSYLVHTRSLILDAMMRAKGLIILLSVTALAAYTLGRHDSPVNHTTVVREVAPVAQAQSLPKPVAFTTPVSPPIAAAATSSATGNPAPPVKTQSEKVATVPPPEKPTPPEVKRKVEIVLTAAAIAAIIIKASRDQYHATGRPCACPDDSMRNGRACGSRSAYSRPGGAAPLCYTHDITPAMIDAYRKTASAQR